MNSGSSTNHGHLYNRQWTFVTFQLYTLSKHLLLSDMHKFNKKDALLKYKDSSYPSCFKFYIGRS